MRKTGQCPKCGSNDVYTDNGMPKRGDRATLGIAGWSHIMIATYVCLECGYLEEYIDQESLVSDKIQKVRENWKSSKK